MRGERLSELVCLERTKLAAGVVLLSPFIPLLFMGEEYGETAPFLYFVSHSDPALVEAVRRGRREEFAAFGWEDEPPDPQDEATFLRAKLKHPLRRRERHKVLLEFHRELLQLRKNIPTLANLSNYDMEVSDYESEKILVIKRWSGSDEADTVFHFGESPVTISIPFSEGRWEKQMDSADKRWRGTGSQLPGEIMSKGEVTFSLSAYAFVLFVKERKL
jgi:maltooligosyltrehalose trehalohydrolase